MKSRFLVLAVFIHCFFSMGCVDDKLNTETIHDLFGSDVNIKLIRKEDLGGLDVHGNIFYYYEYSLRFNQLNSILQHGELKDYPSFTSGYFENRKLLDSAFLTRWTHFPLKKAIDSSVFAATFRTSSANSMIEGVQPYLDSANYYSCINAVGPGNCFFILVPKSSKLYWIIRKG